MRVDFTTVCKRRRLTTIDPMDIEQAKAKLAEAKQKLGREIRVFETLSTSPAPVDLSNAEESDDYYNFTAEDYFRVSSSKKEEKFLKTRKLREAEEAARRSRITKVVIRVRFPDNYTLEATFHPSETIQSLVDLLSKVIARPEVPFYIYTTPPKKHLKDMSQDFYAAGFVPGAVVYFSYHLQEGDHSGGASGPFLQEEVLSLKGLELIAEQAEEPVQPAPEPVIANPTPPPAAAIQGRKPADKKAVKPKWLKM